MVYSLDLRERVISYVNKGHTREATSEVFGIGIRTVNRWVSRFRSGQLAATKASKSWKKINPQALIQEVETNPEYKQSDFAKIFKTSTAAICLAFKALGITRKKD